MKLRAKTLLVIGATLVGLNAVVSAISSTILSNSLKKAEEQAVRERVEVVLNVFDQTQAEFSSSFADWSAWEDTYNFIENPNEAYIQSNLVPEQLAIARLNLAVLIHSSGEIVFGTAFDLNKRKNIPIPEELRQRFSPNDRLVRRSGTNTILSGMVLLPQGAMLITSQPILNNYREGPIRGTMIFGRYLNGSDIQKLANLTRLPLSFYSINDAKMPLDFQDARLNLSEKNFIIVRPLNERTIAGYAWLKDIYNKPAMILRVDIPREIYQQGKISQNYLILSVLIAGLVFSGITLLLLEQLVLFRLAALNHQVESIGSLSDLKKRVSIPGKDELSNLANTINKLIQRVADYTGELKEKNQQISQAHNQLSQALCDLQQTQAQLIQSEKMSSLGQMVAGVAHEINNPVGFIYGNIEHINNYMQDLLELVELYQQQYPNPTPVIQNKIIKIELDFLISDLPKTLSSMSIGTERIREIVLSLRNFARLDETGTKFADIREGIDNTLLILNHKVKHEIEVIKKYGCLPLVECYPAQLNQVFMNIISNAIDALEDKKDEQNKQIIIHTKTFNNKIIVSIQDNGAGIPPEIKEKIFEPFFTTKGVGKGTGLGLAICYQIVKKHHGQIEVISQLDQGTEFIINLPIYQPVSQAVSTACGSQNSEE